MRGFSWLLAAAALVAPVLSAPVVVVSPGGAEDVTISDKTTLNDTHPVTNATKPANSIIVDVTETSDSGGNPNLPLKFVNNFAGDINAYVTGIDSDNNVVMLQPNGQWYTLSGSYSTPQLITADVALPVGGQGSTYTINLPSFVSSARIWFACGSLKFYIVNDGEGNPSLVEPSSTNPQDPNAGIQWGFVELTNNSAGVYANISYVDFVGLPLGMSLNGGNGATQSANGLVANAVADVCNDLVAQANKDGQPWDQLCQVDSAGTALRAVAPPDYIALNPNAWSGYYDDYVDQVWSKYSSEPLTFNTQSSAGQVACTVSGDTLNCPGARAFTKPTVTDIWGCNSGPFAIQSTDTDVYVSIVPRLCAAFVRSTLLLDGGNVQPSLGEDSYYTVSPTDWYSAIVHKYESDGKGYAFSYDDVSPTGSTTDTSGSMADGNPQLLTINIGN